MPYPFDLERALAGEPLVDGRGREYTDFKKRETGCRFYPYSALSTLNKYSKRKRLFTSTGRFYFIEESDNDLYMVYESAEAYKKAMNKEEATAAPVQDQETKAKGYFVTPEVFQATIQHLSTRPWAEVNDLINALSKSPLVDGTFRTEPSAK